MHQIGAILTLIATSTVAAAAIVPPLPEPVTNNAVATVRAGGQVHIVSLLGLGPGKTWRDTRAGGYMLSVGSMGWRSLPDVPDGQGRLAAAMVAAGGRILLFGGYTVAADGAEASTPFVYSLDVLTQSYQRLADIPVPVDDAVALVYQDRDVYLVSGWHDRGNVALVQRYDAPENRWTQATAFPGTPVFGHAGAIAGHELLVCDGVKVQGPPSPIRYAPSDECWRGTIDPADPDHITWQSAPRHPGPARYRMAAVAIDDSRLLFVGGSANPYNYDGIGYDGRPSEPATEALVFDLVSGDWRSVLAAGTMDLRGLAVVDDEVIVIGGMRADQQVSDTSVRLLPKQEQAPPDTKEPRP